MSTLTIGVGGTYATIQAASNAAVNSDALEIVDSATYAENVTIANGAQGIPLQNVTLRAATGCTPTIAKATGDLLTLASGVKGFTVRGASASSRLSFAITLNSQKNIVLSGSNDGFTAKWLNINCAAQGYGFTAAGTQTGAILIDTVTFAGGRPFDCWPVVPSSLTFRDCIATAVYAAFLRAGGWGGEITRCQITGKQILESLTSVVGTPAIQGCLLVQTATSTGFIGVPASPFVIRGNTLIGGGWSIGVNVGCNPNAGVAVHGNIITGFNVGITALVAGIPACQYGDCWGNVTANYAGHASAGVGSISVNPLFIGSGNYRLQTGSPCYDTGGSIMSGQTDIDGHARPQGMACDMGAFETEVPTITYTADAYRGAPTDAYACDLTGAPLDGYGPLDLYPASPVVTLARLVLTSLLSDREALASDRIPDGTTDRRGWWADSYNDDKRKTGSRLWLLASSPIRDDTAKQAKSYAEEALAWMVKDGIAAAVTVEAELQGSSQERRVAVGVTVTKDDGTGVRLQFPELWTIYGG